MPSVLLTDAAPTEILPAKPGQGATLQNTSNHNLYLRWDGGTTVSAGGNLDTSGVRLKKGAWLDIENVYAPIIGIGEAGAGSGLEVRYILRRTSI